jgi:hypothetical protein
MTSRVGKLALVIAAAGGLSVAALSPASVEAGVIHGRPMLAAPTMDSNIVQVVCDRRLSNLWSCNDDPVVRDRRVQSPNRYASQCERTLSNLWSCNDDPVIRNRRGERVQDRRVQSPNRYAAHPCDHSYEFARDGSRCGNRAADKRPGGR